MLLGGGGSQIQFPIRHWNDNVTGVKDHRCGSSRITPEFD